MSRWIGSGCFFILAFVFVVLPLGFPRVGQASMLEEMAGELRLHAPAECEVLFDSLDAAAFGELPPGSGRSRRGLPAIVSLSIPGGTLAAAWVRDNGTRGVDPSTGRPLVPSTINANAFDAICAQSKGSNTLDLTACNLDVFNSQNLVIPTNSLSPTLAVLFGTLFSGQDPDAIAPITGGGLFLALAGYGPEAQVQVRTMTAGNNGLPAGARTPLVPLVVDPNDGPVANHPVPIQNLFTQYGLSPVLTDEQEALLGCGPFYGTNCDIDGVGLMRSELSALVQSWPIPEGEPVCTRYEGSMPSILPGCRGPGDPGYNINVDGSTSGADLLGNDFERVHPFTGEAWASEIAIFSWNYLKSLVAFSFPEDPNNPRDDEFDPNDPLRTDGCSFASPLPCCSVAQQLSITTRAPGENASRPPLRHWLWETGAEYLVTEATGELEDFLGWTIFAFGPEQSRVGEAEVGVPLFLSPPDPLPAVPDSPLVVIHPGADGSVGTEDDNIAAIAYGVVTDRDGDGILDASDNCTEAENASQLDSDGDDYGNACDCDFDQNLACSIADFSIFREDYIATMDRGVGTDMDGNGAVSIADFSLFRDGYVAGEPGPSGLVP